MNHYEDNFEAKKDKREAYESCLRKNIHADNLRTETS